MLADLCMDVFFSGIASAFVAVQERVCVGGIGDLVAMTEYGFYFITHGKVEYVEGIYWYSENNFIHVDVGERDYVLESMMMRIYNWDDVIGYITI